MTMNGPRLRTLLRQAKRAQNAGKLAAAEQSYREILDEAPDSAEAWLGLAGLLKDPQEKEHAYEKVLALDAENIDAQIGLATLRGEPIPEREEEPEPEPEEKLAADLKTAVSPSLSTPTTKPSKSVDEEPQLYCYRHPDRSTALRCYSCNRPICSSCTNKTPVGYICNECKHQVEEKFFSASKLDYLIAGIVSFILSLIAGAVVMRLGSSFFMILIIFFAGGAVGGFIGKLTQRVVGGRRGRYIPHLVAAMVILGVVIPAMPYLLVALMGGFGALFGLLVPAIYAFIASSAAFYWMR